MIWHVLSTILLASAVEAAPRTSPPDGAIVVAPSNADYPSLQSAIDSIPLNFTGTTTIFIQPGNYSGQTHILPGYQGQILVYGSTEDDQDYAANQVILSNGLSSSDAGGNIQSATLWVDSPNISFYNILIENTAGDRGPSHALSTGASYIGFYGCSLTGWQDTIWIEDPDVVFKNSYIEGAVDFIYGADGNIWFESCDIGLSREAGGYITASGRDEQDPWWYVINNSRVISKPGVSVKPESVLLGRAWRDHARVVFQNTELSDIIDPVGWSPWGATDPSNIYYAEFNNSGLGSDTFGRVEWSYQLNTPVIMDEIMPGWQNWVDIEYWG